LIEAWKPVLKGVIEFLVMARQMWMDLSEVNPRAVIREKVVGAHQPRECASCPFASPAIQAALIHGFQMASRWMKDVRETGI